MGVAGVKDPPSTATAPTRVARSARTELTLTPGGADPDGRGPGTICHEYINDPPLESAVSALTVRPAQEQDREQVFAISATVWEGQDYIPLVWSGWMEESPEAGFTIAAEMDGQVVAVQHTALQPGAVAWMEGIRVHPDFRGQGIAHRLLADGIRESARMGARTVRLSTASVNQASRRVASGAGLRLVARFEVYSADPAASQGPGTRAISASFEHLERVGSLASGGTLLVADGWTAVELPTQASPGDFPIWLGAGDPVEAVALARPSPARPRLNLVHLAGTRDGIRDLGTQLRHEAHRRGLQRVTASLQLDGATKATLLDIGFQQQDDWDMLVFEGDVGSAMASLTG